MSSATKNWTFDANAESWTNSTSTRSIATWLSATGDPSSGCLLISASGTKVSAGGGYWQYKGDYSGIFGIATDAVINSIGGAAGDDYHWKLSSVNTSSQLTLGPVQLLTTQGATILGTFSAAGTIATVVAAWATRGLGSVAPPAGSLGKTSVVIRINYVASLGNATAAKAEVLIDSFTFTVDYSLVSISSLTVSELSHTHQIAPIEAIQNVGVSISSISHSHNIAAIPINQNQTLIIFPLTHTHQIDTNNVGQIHIFSVAGIQHNHTIDNITLSQASNIIVSAINHGHLISSLTAHQTQEIIVAHLNHNHQIDSNNLGQLQYLSLSALSHSHTADSVSASQASSLFVANIQHGHLIGSIPITQTQKLIISSLEQNNLISPVSCSQRHILSCAGILQNQTISSADAYQNQIIISASLNQSHSIGSVEMFQRLAIVVSHLVQYHLVELITASQTSASGFINISDLLQSHNITGVTLKILGLDGHLSSIHNISKMRINNFTDELTIQSKKHILEIKK